MLAVVRVGKMRRIVEVQKKGSERTWKIRRSC